MPQLLQEGSVTMSGTMSIIIRPMEADDYENVYRLWENIQGFGLRSVDDSREGVERFLKRNPGTSVVAEQNGRIVGTILCGHDGRQGSFYHVCVERTYRKRGVGERMVRFALRALQREGISKVTLVAFTTNHVGNSFWKELGWMEREDFNYYEFIINEENITRFIR